MDAGQRAVALAIRAADEATALAIAGAKAQQARDHEVADAVTAAVIASLRATAVPAAEEAT